MIIKSKLKVGEVFLYRFETIPFVYSPLDKIILQISEEGFNQLHNHPSIEAWKKLLAEYEKAYPDLATELHRRLSAKLPISWSQINEDFIQQLIDILTR